MSFDAFFDSLCERKIKAERDFDLKHSNTFHIGGTCSVAVFPKNEQELCLAARLAAEYGLPFAVIGKGSNCLFYDGRIEKVIIFTQRLCDAKIDGDVVSCGAGVSLVALSKKVAEASLSGLEFACGIPGSVGGAVYMNAGAHGGAISDILVSSRAFDTSKMEVVTLSAEEHNFDYRKSVYMAREELICLGATLKLSSAPTEEIAQKMSENTKKRRATQPIEAFSAGSYFKRPVGDAAGRLIDVCGLKGYAVGGACVSEKHAGFVINTGNATFEEVLSLEEYIVATVYQKTGVKLDREVEIIR